MYGLVNQAIQGLITETYGEKTWNVIKERAGVKDSFFLSTHIYDDSVTYNLATEAALYLNISVEAVLAAFGKYWILKIGKEKYGSLMASGGDSLMVFLENLPNFHSRVMLIYPDITPPEFKSEKLGPRQIRLHYFSTRKGLSAFMKGLIEGLGQLYQTKCTVVHEFSDETSISRHTFLVTVEG